MAKTKNESSTKKNTKKKVVKSKPTQKKSKKGFLSNELKDLAKILSGEMEIVEREEKLEESKKKAEIKRRQSLVDSIKEGEVELESDVKTKKIVQNIKIFEWEAAIRVKFPFEMKAFLSVVAAALVFIVFLAILQHYMLMLSIIAILFLIYIAGTTEPQIVEHFIMARGMDTLDRLYEWVVLDEFWFTVKNEQHVLIIDTKLKFPGRLIMLIDLEDRGAIFALLQEKLLYREVKSQSRMEKVTFGEYVSLEDV